MMNTHTDECIHMPFYSGDEPCAANDGVWNAPQGWYVDEAKGESDDETPYCRVHLRAWELQTADES